MMKYVMVWQTAVLAAKDRNVGCEFSTSGSADMDTSDFQDFKGSFRNADQFYFMCQAPG
jgi:hypothetical protein